eukprot:6203348-Prymnesium_polylepis.2
MLRNGGCAWGPARVVRASSHVCHVRVPRPRSPLAHMRRASCIARRGRRAPSRRPSCAPQYHATMWEGEGRLPPNRPRMPVR